MTNIKINLFGNPSIIADGETVNFPYKKVEGFLYYLCVKKSVTREEVICLLWGDEDETTGKKKLRDAVYQVRRVLGKEFLITTGHTGIALTADPGVEIDWDHAFAEGASLEQAIFLDHFYIKNSYEFEEWVENVRNTCRQDVSKRAREGLSKAQASQDVSQIQEYSNILIKNDPYDEELYYEIMNLYAENGNYTMAIRLYYDMQKIFKEDLELEPSQKVKDLFYRVFNVKEHVKTEGASGEQPFVGRKKELYQISGFLERSVGGKVSCAAIEGEEGVGKTSFLECGLKLASGKQMLPLYAVCYRQGAEFFLNPWNDIFQELEQYVENGTVRGGLSKQREEMLARLLKGGLGENGENGHVTYQKIEQLVLSIFQEITRENRIVLAFDDVQWMDQMSFQLLNRLLFSIGPEKLLFMCTYNRGSDAEVVEALEPLMRRDSVMMLSLQPFTEEETDDILHKFLPELDQDGDKRRNIYEATDGNAFFLKELINLIREKGYTLEKSPKTNFVIKARLSGISKEEKEVLDCMAVFPERISIEEIELLLNGMDRLSLLKILERLQESFLIKEVLVGWNVYYKFVHRVFQEYIYEKQSNGKKQMYHRILAQYYEAQAEQNFNLLPRVVYHYERCHNEVKAYQYQIRYLKEYYTIINENFPVLQQEVSDMGSDFGVRAEADKMLKLAEDVIKLEDDTMEIRQMKMEMHYIKGRYDIAMGDYDSGIANIEKSMVLARRMNAHKTLLACYRQQVFHGIQREDRQKVEKYVELGLDCIRKEEADEYATFLRLKGWYCMSMQEYRMAEKVLQKAIEVFGRLEDGGGKYTASIAACYNYMGDIYKAQERYEEALKFYEKGIEEGRGPVEINGLGQLYSSIGQVKYFQKDYESAFKYLEMARECLDKNGYRWGLERAEAFLALTCLKTGQREAAGIHYEKGAELSEKIGNPTTERLLEAIRRELEQEQKNEG